MLQHYCCITCTVITAVVMTMIMIQKTNRCDSKFKHSRVSQTQTFSEIQSIPGQNLCWRVMQLVLLKCCHNLDIWLAVHHSITFLLLPTWYTNFSFIHTNYIKLNSSTCFERNPLIIRRSKTQIVHMQPLKSSLCANDRLVQPLRKDQRTNNSSLTNQVTDYTHLYRS